MEQSDKPFFVFYIVRQLIISAQALSREYHRAWAFPYPSSYIRMYILYSCTCSLAVDNFSCRAFILQKLSFSKVFLLCLIRQVSLIFSHPSKDLNLFFHYYPFLFLTPKATQLLTHQPKFCPGKIKLCSYLYSQATHEDGKEETQQKRKCSNSVGDDLPSFSVSNHSVKLS